MQRDSISRLIKELAYFDGVEYAGMTDYGQRLTDWMIELTAKNRIIYYRKIVNNSDAERVGRPRGKVYFADFGVNVGSEFNYPHFCVVIREFDRTAIVVPLSSVKANDGHWKNPDNLIIEIGPLEDLPGDGRSCYAMVNQIRNVSKKRLDEFRDGTGIYHALKLTRAQMDLIDEQLKKLTHNML